MTEQELLDRIKNSAGKIQWYESSINEDVDTWLKEHCKIRIGSVVKTFSGRKTKIKEVSAKFENGRILVSGSESDFSFSKCPYEYSYKFDNELYNSMKVIKY